MILVGATWRVCAAVIRSPPSRMKIDFKYHICFYISGRIRIQIRIMLIVSNPISNTVKKKYLFSSYSVLSSAIGSGQPRPKPSPLTLPSSPPRLAGAGSTPSVTVIPWARRAELVAMKGARQRIPFRKADARFRPHTPHRCRTTATRAAAGGPAVPDDGSRGWVGGWVGRGYPASGRPLRESGGGQARPGPRAAVLKQFTKVFIFPVTLNLHKILNIN